MSKIIYLANKKKLNDFIIVGENSCFLQSWEWGEFQEKMGSRVYRIGREEDGKLIAAATLIKKPLPAGRSYFYCPRGPITSHRERITPNESANDLFGEIQKLAKKENCIFLRFEPKELIDVARSELCVRRTADIQPGKTLILDLRKTKEELLKNMHQKTRYNIRLAEKKGVLARAGDKEDFKNFWEIMEETERRDGFRLHKREYYRKMIENFSSPTDFLDKGDMGGASLAAKSQIANLQIKLYVAEYQGKIIAGSLVSFFGDTATYLHGASANEHRNVMAPYLLQWQAVKSAQAKGCRYYDMYGIAEEKWPGVTRFKKGFGGKEIDYPGTYDLVFNKKWYALYKLSRKIRRRFLII